MADTMFAEKEKKIIISAVQSIPLSKGTNARRLEQLDDNIKGIQLPSVKVTFADTTIASFS